MFYKAEFESLEYSVSYRVSLSSEKFQVNLSRQSDSERLCETVRERITC